MPSFTEQEKARIRECLLDEGERLFVAHGIKKVTIDDIVRAVGIAKATFYKFYEGKEYLFLDIAQAKQKEIFDILEGVLKGSEEESSGKRVKLVFFSMSELMEKYPLLTGIDAETAEHIARKISPERLAEFQLQGFDAVETIKKHGIRFRYDKTVISCLFHTLYQSWLNLQKETPEMQKQVIDIILDGIIEQIL